MISFLSGWRSEDCALSGQKAAVEGNLVYADFIILMYGSLILLIFVGELCKIAIQKNV